MEAERGAFLFSKEGGGEEIREVSFVYVPKIVHKVADLLTQRKVRVTITNYGLFENLNIKYLGLAYSHGTMTPSQQTCCGLSWEETRGTVSSNLPSNS